MGSCFSFGYGLYSSSFRDLFFNQILRPKSLMKRRLSGMEVFSSRILRFCRSLFGFRLSFWRGISGFIRRTYRNWGCSLDSPEKAFLTRSGMGLRSPIQMGQYMDRRNIKSQGYRISMLHEPVSSLASLHSYL